MRTGNSILNHRSFGIPIAPGIATNRTHEDPKEVPESENADAADFAEEFCDLHQWGAGGRLHWSFHQRSLGWVQERQWQKTQKFTVRPDKTVGMTMRVAITPDLVV